MRTSENITPADDRVSVETTDAPRKPRVPADPVEWTIMIFMVGDNNLSEKCEADLREIKKAGSSRDVTVIVQTDLSEGGGPTKRYLITPDRSLEEDVDAQWPETRPEVLRDFLHWTLKYHPAERYMLLLWGHGRALDSFGVPTELPAHDVDPRVRDAAKRKRDERLSRRAKYSNGSQAGKPFFIICPDDQAGPVNHRKEGHAISNMELKSILQSVSHKIEGGKIHVLGMVACLMGMFEMCYELRDGVHYMIASESLIPDTSLPFDKVIPFLIENPKIEPADVCRTIVREFQTFYVKEDDDELPVQLSAFDLTKAEELRTKIDDLAQLLKTKIEAGDKETLNAVLGSHFQTQRYDEDQFFDLYDFCFMLKENCTNAEIHNLCERIMKFIGCKEHPNFVIASEFHGDAMQFSYGLAIYFPWVSVNGVRYLTLEFAHPVSNNQRSTWLDFLNTYVDKISKVERSARDGGEQESVAAA